VAAWMASALRMLAGGLAFGAGSELAVRAVPGGFQGISGGAGPGADPSVKVHPLFHEHKHRRRRRRALTQGDKADIAFIVATLGAPAGKSFAMIIAAKVG